MNWTIIGIMGILGLLTIGGSIAQKGEQIDATLTSWMPIDAKEIAIKEAGLKTDSINKELILENELRISGVEIFADERFTGVRLDLSSNQYELQRAGYELVIQEHYFDYVELEDGVLVAYSHKETIESEEYLKYAMIDMMRLMSKATASNSKGQPITKEEITNKRLI